MLALVGLALLVGVPQGGHDPLAVLAGTAAAALAGTGFAVMTLLGARPVTGLDASFATGAAFLAGGLLLAVPAALTGGMAFPATVVGAGLLALLVVVPTALAYTAYFRGLSRSDAAGTGVVVALLEPLTAAVLAAAVLGERLGVVGTVGALGLAAAVLRAASAERYRRAEQPVPSVSGRPSNRAPDQPPVVVLAGRVQAGPGAIRAACTGPQAHGTGCSQGWSP